jgi:hypothetical protein
LKMRVSGQQPFLWKDPSTIVTDVPDYHPGIQARSK